MSKCSFLINWEILSTFCSPLGIYELGESTLNFKLFQIIPDDLDLQRKPVNDVTKVNHDRKLHYLKRPSMFFLYKFYLDFIQILSRFYPYFIQFLSRFLKKLALSKSYPCRIWINSG